MSMSMKEIQTALIKAGFDPGIPDGIYGNRTRDAVKEFQKKNHLEPDGNPGLVTQEVLESVGKTPTSLPPSVSSTTGFSLPISRITRPIDTLFWHCTATPEGKEFTRQQIKQMHLQRGFSDIGYHLLVHLDGRLEIGRSWNTIGAHVANHNTGSLGFSYIGGVKADGKTAVDSRTPAQKKAMEQITEEVATKFKLKKILGHRDASPDKNHNGLIEPSEWIKVCPCFNAITEYKHFLVK